MSQYHVPFFSETEQTPAQRWKSTRWAIGSGASDSRVPSQEMGQLMLRYVAGEIDLAQVGDEGVLVTTGRKITLSRRGWGHERRLRLAQRA